MADYLIYYFIKGIIIILEVIIKLYLTFPRAFLHVTSAWSNCTRASQGVAPEEERWVSVRASLLLGCLLNCGCTLVG